MNSIMMGCCREVIMQLYWPRPTPPGMPNDCWQCGAEIDGEEIKGLWLERKHWQNPNTHELTCLSCCVDELNASSNVANEAGLKSQLS
jgi:hypothetical protein